MAQRVGWLVIALGGVLLIAGLALLGRDVHCLARSGPKWRRRLVSAGLALLSVFGLPACGETKDTTPATVKDDGQPATILVEARGWERVAATWQQADDIASGKLGPYPFDRRSKERLIEALGEAGRDIDSLEAGGLLSESEARILKLDLADLTKGVQRKRSVEEKGFSCYAPMPFFWQERSSLERLSARLPLLEKMASGKLRPEVLAKALVRIKEDLNTLAGQSAQRMPEAERLKVEEVRKAAEALVAKLKAALGE